MQVDGLQRKYQHSVYRHRVLESPPSSVFMHAWLLQRKSALEP